MRKLNKKQSKIIQGVKDSIEMSISSMQNFQDQGRYEMVSHCQDQIRARINGIASYIIYSDHKLWDQRLIKAFAEIENQYVLSSDYAHLSFDNDTFISENDFEKYGTSAIA